MSDHRTATPTLLYTEHADTRARRATQPSATSKPSAMTGSHISTSPSSTPRRLVTPTPQPASTTTGTATVRGTRAGVAEPPAMSEPPAMAAASTNKGGGRTRRDDTRLRAEPRLEVAARRRRAPHRRPAPAAGPERPRWKATIKRDVQALEGCTISSRPPRTATAILITLAHGRGGIGGPWRGLGWHVNPEGPWRGADALVSPPISPLPTHPCGCVVHRTFGSSVLQSVVLCTFGESPFTASGRPNLLSYTLRSLAAQRGDARCPERIKLIRNQTKAYSHAWHNSQSIKYIDHRLPWQVEGSSGNHA